MTASREERMQQRMRGAGRHEVADESFGLILPVEESPEATEAAPAPVPPSVSLTRSTPNTSAKRRRLSTDTTTLSRPEPVAPEPIPARPRSEPPSSASKIDPYDVNQDVSPEMLPPGPALLSSARSIRSARSVRPEAEEVAENAEDTLESLPDAIVPRLASRDSPSRLSLGPNITEEVTESPAGAPGSGHRRRVRISDVATQSAQLQRAVMEDEAGTTEVITSSPLARKTRMSGASAGALSAHSARRSTRSTSNRHSGDVDELTPLVRPPRKSDSIAASSSPRSTRSVRRNMSADVDGPDELSAPISLLESRRRAQAKSKINDKRVTQPVEIAETVNGEDGDTSMESRRRDQAKSKTKDKRLPRPMEVADRVDGEDGEADVEEAEEIDVNEAARRIGRKRPRTSPSREESPEHDSRLVESVPPAKKRRQKRTHDSTAKQSQPKPQKNKPKTTRRRRSDGRNIPIAVQRYTKHQHINEENSDEDVLSSEIPFANRSGVNVVDVLSQMCDEVIDTNLATLHEAASNAEDSTTRKEYRVKLRALEAFQTELHSRLLEHTITLDNLHALQRRVRSVQKEKLLLRNEIMRIRAEKEQVALKMDAVRTRHEVESKESLRQLNLSTAMHDIDLAVEAGRAASELGPKEQKAADIANLELLVSRVAGQACRDGDSTGNLKQLKDFNAFLERTAMVLEVR